MSDVLKLSLEDISFLMELEKSGVVLKAGSVFNMSPSTASRNLTRISGYFPTPIFKFEGGSWRATDYFKLIRPNLIEMIKNAQTLMAQSFDAKTSERTYVISYMMTEVEHVVGGILPKLMERSPRSRLDLSKHENELAAVVNGLADFAIVTAVGLPADVHVMRLYPVTRVILVRRNHPLTFERRQLTKKILIPYDRVSILTGRSASWTSPEQNIFPYERYMEHTRYSTSRFHTAWEAMSKTDLICVCGWRAAEIAMRSHDLVALPLPIDAEEDELWNVLIWSDVRHKDPAIIWMRSLFSEWAQEEAARIAELEEKGKGPPTYKKRRSSAGV
ncbi:LysR substrate-binding domain-containing protein [uncultured Parasutterella sp.]|uniref:LysR substrate-binding domain-containing protein n=1 Tax=uncultured Parasutterella sp. TaxID=1263098 RepID=UPI0025B3A013|nr:LysR substrate-binding domain-containing protein [uncultured Parasutterella sp.]